MEENMFYDFLVEYEKLSEELINLDFIDRSSEIERLEGIIQRREEFIQKCRETVEKDTDNEKVFEESTIVEEAVKIMERTKEKLETIKRQQIEKKERKRELENRLEDIKEEVMQKKEKSLEKEKKPIRKAYANYMEQEAEIKEKLEVFKDIELDITTEDSEELIDLLIELKKIRKEAKMMEQELNQVTGKTKQIEEDYKRFLQQLKIWDEKIEEKIAKEKIKQLEYEEKEDRTKKDFSKMGNSDRNRDYLESFEAEYEKALEAKEEENSR